MSEDKVLLNSYDKIKNYYGRYKTPRLYNYKIFRINSIEIEQILT